MKKKLLIIIMALILVVGVLAAFRPLTVELITPVNEAYWLIGENNLTFLVNSSPLTYFNVTNVTLYHNISGTWAANETNGTNGTNSSKVSRTFVNAQTTIYPSLTDGTVFLWGASSTNNIDNTTFSIENRTVFVEQAPTLNSQLPATGTNKSSNSVVLSLNLSSTSTPSEYFRCFLYTNQSGANRTNGTWGIMPGVITVVNASITNYTHIFEDEVTALWNVQCFEGASTKIYKWGENLSVQVSSSTITVTLDNPSGNSVTNLTSSTQQVNMTATSTMLDTCFVWINDTENVTNTTMTSGTSFNIVTLSSLSEANHKVTVGCNDSAGRYVNATSLVIRIDTTFPTLSNVTNYTIESCTKWGVNFTASEVLSSSSVHYGRTSPTGTTNTNTMKMASRIHNITFSPYDEGEFQLNITLTDIAGNINNTILRNYTMPFGLCSNLSLVSIYKAQNLSDLEESITYSDFIFYFNETSQSFLTKTNGTSTNAGFDLVQGDVVWISTSTDRTWFRNNTPVEVVKNVAINNSYVGLIGLHTFYGLSNTTFANATGNKTISSQPFTVDFFASWNNSGKNWESHTDNTTWNNDTRLGRFSNTSLDALWVSSNFTITVNFTANYVTGNWS